MPVQADDIKDEPDRIRETEPSDHRGCAEAMKSEPRWNPSAPALWIAEGLLMYLDESDVVSLMKTILALANSASELVFTS
jgi:hypothetical protein